jgi:diketogulonate reductase-like aldo/keto reductase
VALAWVRAKGALPLLGARTTAQLQDNLGCLDMALSPDHVARLDTVSAAPLGFPHEFLTNSESVTFGGFAASIDRAR